MEQLTRRQILKGFALTPILLPLFVEACLNSNSSFELPLGERFVKLPAKLPSPPEQPTEKDILDPEYVKKLITLLKEKRGSPDERIQAIINNLCVIIHPEKGFSNALRIDQSGYFVTAAHVLNQNPALVYDPRSGRTARITSLLSDQEYDVVIFYAPFKETREPVKNVQIRTTEIDNDSKLWLLALDVGTTTREVTLDIMNGTYDDFYTDPESPFKNQIKVRGMKPFGGSSGGPVIDKEGRLFGLESGRVNLNDNDTETIALVSPVEHLTKTFGKPIQMLPL